MARRDELKHKPVTPYSDLPNEIWKDIKEFEGLYQVSNMGRVKSMPKQSKFHRLNPTIRKQVINQDGYCVLQLFKNKVSVHASVHRLVAIAFIPNPENKPEVNHKKGNKLDNRASELEWNTPKENVNNSFKINGNYVVKAEKHHHSKLTNIQVIEMRDEFKGRKRGEVSRLANKYNIHTSTVFNILSRRTYKSVL